MLLLFSTASRFTVHSSPDLSHNPVQLATPCKTPKKHICVALRKHKWNPPRSIPCIRTSNRFLHEPQESASLPFLQAREVSSHDKIQFLPYWLALFLLRPR